LTYIPPQIAFIPSLQSFSVDNNPLIFPPQAIADQGSDAVLEYLRQPPPGPPYGMSASIWMVMGFWIGCLICVRSIVRRL